MVNSRSQEAPVVRAVLFDFDGTLTLPGQLDFAALKAEINCPFDKTILEFISFIEDRDERYRAEQVLHRFEERAAEFSEPNPGAEELLLVLKAKEIPFGIITRNTRESVLRALDNFAAVESTDFAVILCRDDDFDPKPSPQGVRQAARQLSVAPSEMLLVGDHWLDVSAGHRAGTTTVFLTNNTGTPPADPAPDFVLSSIGEMVDLIGNFGPES